MAVNPKTQAFRVERLKEAVKRYGDENALGKALRWKNGAFVRQMVREIRPVSEKTVAQIEALPGMAGWFAQAEDEPLKLTPEERALVLTFRQRLLDMPQLPPDDGRRHLRSIIDAAHETSPPPIRKVVSPSSPPRPRTGKKRGP